MDGHGCPYAALGVQDARPLLRQLFPQPHTGRARWSRRGLHPEGLCAEDSYTASYAAENTSVPLKRGRIATESLLAKAIGKDRKGKLSVVLYALAIPLAFVNRWAAQGIFVFIALVWLIPDRRIEKMLQRDSA